MRNWLVVLLALAASSAMAQTTSTTELIVPDIFNIDVEGGVAIGGAIIKVWAAGWVFRVFVQLLRQNDPESSEKE